MKKTPKKKNDKTLFVAAVIVFALAVGLFIGSYARYYNTYTASGQTITAADWSFTVNGATSNFNVDLLNPGDHGSVSNLVTITSDQTTVKKIQPGSSGYYDFVLSAVGSDVNVIYNISFGTLTWQGGTPAEGFTWSVAETTSGSPVAVTETSGVYSVTEGEITAGATRTYRITWEWAYGSNTDTSYNASAGKTLTLSNTTVTGWQKQPTA